MTSQKIIKAILATATLVAAAPLSASNNPGAHQHGHAELQLAVDGNQIDLIFTSPAYNLLGFEHRARTEEQKARVSQTNNWLGETPLVDTTEGSCTVMNAVVHHQAGGEDHNHSHDHKHDHEEQSSHSDFEVTQTLSCSDLDTAETLSTPLTEQFPEIEHLDVEWVWSGGQGSGRLDHGENSFRLRAQ
ncbi:ZrgA family zinc uptake protein [Marinobacter sp.]|uniref:ZrgA family zinc uptake protein n=1 Tax=Marinobacter sp. TaxID=50741 RepID=UPI003566B7B4